MAEGTTAAPKGPSKRERKGVKGKDGRDGLMAYVTLATASSFY